MRNRNKAIVLHLLLHAFVTLYFREITTFVRLNVHLKVIRTTVTMASTHFSSNHKLIGTYVSIYSSSMDAFTNCCISNRKLYETT